MKRLLLPLLVLLAGCQSPLDVAKREGFATFASTESKDAKHKVVIAYAYDSFSETEAAKCLIESSTAYGKSYYLWPEGDMIFDFPYLKFRLDNGPIEEKRDKSLLNGILLPMSYWEKAKRVRTQYQAGTEVVFETSNLKKIVEEHKQCELAISDLKTK